VDRTFVDWMARFLGFVMVLALLVPHGALAEIPSGGVIKEIRIDGTQRVEAETVRSYLLVQPGDMFDSERIDQSLKALFATGLFADVNLRRENDALIVKVTENPVINRIAFEGNHKLTDDALQRELQLRPRVVYTRQRVQNDVKRILDLYRRNGRFAATVEPKIVTLKQNRVDLIFEIDEGAVTGVRSINFVGNREFSASRLREIIQTKESRWYRFLSTDDNYDPDRLTLDRDLLRKFYLSEGYADFNVISAVAELTPARDGFFITYTIEEGPRYRFGKIDITNELKSVDVESLRPLITTVEGDWYDADRVDKSITAITDALGNRGFAFVDAHQPKVKRNPDTRTIDITYDVKEGPKVFVERIDITGNVRTLDSVIRREFQIVEGDAFNTSKIQRSKQKVKDLGFFKNVEVTNAPGSAPDRTVLNVALEEQSTGEFSVGLGFSTTDGPLADISIRERNLLGRGQDLRLGTVIAQRTQQVDLSFTEPYFLDRNVSAGADLFLLTQDNQDISGYQQFSIGGSLRAGYQITDSLRQTLRYTLRQDRIFNLVAGVSRFIADQAGERVTSSVGQTLIYDKRDNRLDPSDGYFVSLSNDLAGVGGDVRYARAVLSGGYFYPLAPQWVVSLTGEGGTVIGLNDRVRIEDRFFVGGDNLRGFALGGIGPRDAVTSDALGGNTYYTGSLSLGFPLGLPKELGITGRVFTDVGSLFGIDEDPQGINDTSAPRASAGFGVSWASPLGPIRLDFAVPYLRRNFDRTEFFRVGFGTRF